MSTTDKNNLKLDSTVPAKHYGNGSRHKRTFEPPVDIFETDDSVVMVADMPGVDENSIDIQLEKNTLKVSGTVADTVQGSDFMPILTEYAVGDFYRVFTLSDYLDKNSIGAVLKNGTLRLTFQKIKAAVARKIPVTAY